jgi:DivIVA domain-containing protein
MRVPLDRQAIEKRDFPIGRRGYDTAAVDAHLARLADEMEALTRQLKRRSGDSLAQAASERVRSIVEAAEASAAAIESSAEDEAQHVRAEAARDAERTRADALERAEDHVGRVSEASGEMLRRVEAMQEELGTLVETLRTGAARVNADLTLLESNMGDLRTAAGERPPETVAATAPEHHSEADLPPTAEVDQFDGGAPEPEPAGAAAEPEPDSVADTEPDRAADSEGARLIALNMALNGQAREETSRYLAENFDLPDREQLLDEVYATIGTG